MDTPAGRMSQLGEATNRAPRISPLSGSIRKLPCDGLAGREIVIREIVAETVP